MADPDVIVVGAGAAGLAAMRTLVERGLSAIALEARDRIGGRAWTDSETFGTPFDRGCAWLHSGDVNPWRPIAARLGLTVIEEKQVWTSRVGSQWLDENDDGDWDRAISSRFAHLAAAGAAERDIAASSVPVEDGRWGGLIEAVITWYTSVDSTRLSTRDIFNTADTDTDYPVLEGYGALVARYGKGLPVSLSTPVTRIAWGGRGVTVETAKGSLRAAAAVIAVPTNVLAAGAIRFEPKLPPTKAEAIANVPLGWAEKVVLETAGNPLGMKPMSFGVARADTPRTVGFQFFPFGRPLVIGFLGGPCARDLLAEGAGAMTAFAIDELTHMFGADARRHIVKSAETAWAGDPFIRGGYSAARPGHAHRRSDLAVPLAERLFFAGEACSTDSFATCHGAYLTGVAAAQAAADALQRRHLT
jgi:monoamine oxidase